MSKRKQRNTTCSRGKRNSKLKRIGTKLYEKVENSNDDDNKVTTEINLTKSLNVGDIFKNSESQLLDQPNVEGEVLADKHFNKFTLSAASPDRGQLALYEDENFLDYEPFEDEVNNDYYSANHSKESGQSKIADGQINHFDLPETSNQNINMNSSKITTHTDISSSFYNGVGDPKNVDKSRVFDDEDMDPDYEELLDQDIDCNRETETNEKNEKQLLYQEQDQEPSKYSFGNAQIKFNGPLNITITRSVTNDSNNKVSIDQNLDRKSSNIKVHDVTTFQSEEKFIHGQSETKKWIRTLSNGQSSISNDNLNSMNWMNSKQSDEIRTELQRPCTELNNQHIFSSSNTSFNSYFENNLIKPVIERYRPENPCVKNQGKTQLSTDSSEENISPSYIQHEFQVQDNYKEDLVVNWLMHTSEDSFLNLLESLCEPHFTSRCHDLRCSKSHSLESIKTMIQESNPQELKKLYEIALKKDVWFMCLFDVFLEYFTVPPNIDKIMLIDMIDDVYKVFNGTFTDKTSYVGKIVESLSKIGLSFKEAIEHIILRYGTSQLWICDILLFLIAKKSNLDDHWCLVQKIICCRREKIDPEVVTELLTASSNDSPQSEELYKRIYEDIFEKDLVDLNKMPRHLRERIIDLDGNHNVIQSDEYPLGVRKDIDIWGDVNISTNRDLEEKPDTIRSFSDQSHSQENLTYNCWSSDSSCDMNVEDESDLPHVPNEETLLLNRHKNNKTQRCSKSRSSNRISERVLQKVVQSRRFIPKPQIPANVIAHPSCQPVIDPCYQCNISLHNLLPEVNGWITAISASDLRRLRRSLVDADIVEFLDVLNSYSGQYTIENFIVTVLTLLKSMRSISEVYSTFISLLDALEEKDPEYMSKTHLKISIEVLALNLIYIFNAKGRWHYSKNVLSKVRDWHSLVTSKIFMRKSKLESHMGRYIYLIKVLLLADDFFWVNEIFQAEALNLLGPATTWPFNYNHSDTNARNKVLKLFFEKGFPQNIFITNDLLKSIAVVYGGLIEGFGVWGWFNNEIASLVNEGESNTSILLLLLNDITNHYERFMDKFVLQAYMLHMKDCIKSEDALKLFKLCCNKEIYPEYMGDEDVVYITTDLTDFEIESILHFYFTNSAIRHVQPHNFCIELLLPGTVPKACKMIEEKYRKNRNVYKVFELVCIILESKYNIIINQPIHSRISVPSRRVSEAQMYKKMC